MLEIHQLFATRGSKLKCVRETLLLYLQEIVLRKNTQLLLLLQYTSLIVATLGPAKNGHYNRR